ncbi:MAG: family 10 glycosylhydrolase [Candidatus Eisenbacteria bacterium]|nr:family 10 glycosylhydrolase [Candidatus Eisenbacteria bacterium]
MIAIALTAACAARAETPGSARADSAIGARADSAIGVRADSAIGVRADSATGARVVDYLWVVRTALLRPDDIERVIERAREMGVHGLLAQVVGRGDAFYRSDLLPRSEALGAARDTDASFDPLAELVERAHRAGLEVHAWMNCLLVWSAPQPPRDPRHVVNSHPEWLARTRDGRKLSQLTAHRRERLGIEGVYLAPANAGVRTFLARIAAEIASRYAVDGIQLDYIRQPGIDVGYDPGTRSRFALATGVDPMRMDPVPAAERTPIDSAWSEFQRAQVTATVREIRDSLAAVRPGLTLSAAVLADTALARERHAQAWTEWVRDGLIDRAFVMCYAAPVQTVMEQLVAYAKAFGLGGRVVPGIAVYNTEASMAAAKILGARELGFPLLALYSYDALEEHSGYWFSLRGSMAAAAARP